MARIHLLTRDTLSLLVACWIGNKNSACPCTKKVFFSSLAVKHYDYGTTQCRHIEVQASMRPVSFISRVPKYMLKPGRASTSAKRSQDELTEGVAS